MSLDTAWWWVDPACRVMLPKKFNDAEGGGGAGSSLREQVGFDPPGLIHLLDIEMDDDDIAFQIKPNCS